MTFAQIYAAAIVVLILAGYIFATGHMLAIVGSNSGLFWRQYTVLTVAMFVIVAVIATTARWVR